MKGLLGGLQQIGVDDSVLGLYFDVLIGVLRFALVIYDVVLMFFCFGMV